MEDLAVRTWRDDKEATHVREERDGLRKQFKGSWRWVVELLDEVEKEREAKLTFEGKASQAATTAERLRQERDEVRQNEGRLCSECDTLCGECDEAQRRVGSL